MNIGMIKVSIDGIYFWGDGFISHEAAELWDRTIREYRGNHIHTGFEDMGGAYVYGIYFGGYIHPMDGGLYMVSPRRIGDIKGPIDELYRLVRKAVVPEGKVSVTYSEIIADGNEKKVYEKRD